MINNGGTKDDINHGKSDYKNGYVMDLAINDDHIQALVNNQEKSEIVCITISECDITNTECSCNSSTNDNKYCR